MKKNNFFTWLLIGLLVIAYYLYESHQERKIEKDKYKTVGKIIDYWVVFPESHYLKYQYEVDGKFYTQKTSTRVTFPGCPETKDCLNKRFVVICERNNPENSTIDLNSEIK